MEDTSAWTADILHVRVVAGSRHRARSINSKSGLARLVERRLWPRTGASLAMNDLLRREVIAVNGCVASRVLSLLVLVVAPRAKSLASSGRDARKYYAK